MSEVDWETLLSAVTAAESTLECLLQPIPDSVGTTCPPSNNSTTLMTCQYSGVCTKKACLSDPGPSPESNLCSVIAEHCKAKELPDAVKRSEQELLQQILSVVKLKLEIPQNPRTSADKNCGEKRAIEMHKRWTENYPKLKEYHGKHGDCLVPEHFPSNPELGKWVHSQRSKFKEYLTTGGGTKLVQNRIAKLNELEFSWHVLDDAWEIFFKTMKAFRDKYGHCNAPNNPEHKSLRGWMYRTRIQYCLFQNGEQSSMTPYRINKLNSIGFEWAFPCTTWQMRFEELVEYKRQHGNCKVPRNYQQNPALASWVSNQRARYWRKGQVTKRSQRRREALCSIGFEWRRKRP